METRAMVWEWTKCHGPISGWLVAFQTEFEDADRNGTVDKFVQQWISHAKVGEALVKDLQCVVGGRLPKDEEQLRDTFQQVIDLISTLYTGIATIEAHLAAFGL